MRQIKKIKSIIAWAIISAVTITALCFWGYGFINDKGTRYSTVAIVAIAAFCYSLDYVLHHTSREGQNSVINPDQNYNKNETQP